MAFTASSQVIIKSRFTNDDGLGEAIQNVNETYEFPLSSGTSANQADRQYAETLSLADGETRDIDLTSVEDAFGTALGAVTVVHIFISSASANTTDITVGGSSADFGGLPGQTVSPGGHVSIGNPGAGIGSVVDGTTDTVRLVNASGAAASVDLYIAVRSA